MKSMSITEKNMKNLACEAEAYKEQIINLLNEVSDDDIACFRFIYTLLNRHIKNGSKWIIG